MQEIQEDEYTKLTTAYSDKFENRLFWTIGGVFVLSLGYFQSTETLKTDPLLILGYTILLISLLLLLAGLRISSSLCNEWAIYFREINNGADEDTEQYDKLKSWNRKINIFFSYLPLFMAFSGIVLIVVYMFVSGI